MTPPEVVVTIQLCVSGDKDGVNAYQKAAFLKVNLKTIPPVGTAIEMPRAFLPGWYPPGGQGALGGIRGQYVQITRVHYDYRTRTILLVCNKNYRNADEIELLWNELINGYGFSSSLAEV